MLDIVSKLKILKSKNYANNILNEIGFKLGSLIFLSFYNRYPNDFDRYEKRIFNVVFRLGYILLITNDLKNIKRIVTKISENLSKSNYITSESAVTDIEKKYK